MLTRLDAVLFVASLASGTMALEDHNRITISSPDPDPFAISATAQTHEPATREPTVGELRNCYHHARTAQLTNAQIMQFEAGAIPGDENRSDNEKTPEAKTTPSAKNC